jgi:hypothetical protein
MLDTVRQEIDALQLRHAFDTGETGALKTPTGSP